MVVRIGIIGTGIISQLQGSAYASVPDAKVVAVCDIDRSLAERRAREWGADMVYTDYHELVMDQNIDAVEVLLPHHLHKDVVIAAAENGKHVSVMKPMALSVAEAKEMTAVAERHSVLLNVSENFLFFGPVMKAIEVLKSGKLGTPRIIRMERVPAYGSPKEYAEPRDAGYWRMDKKKSGGLVFDDIVHFYAIARFLMQSDVLSVSALLTRPSSPFEIPGVVMWKHADSGKYGNFAYSSVVRSRIPTEAHSLHETVEVICDEGILWIPNISARLIPDAPLTIFKDGNATAYKDVDASYAASFRSEVQHYVDSVRTNTPTLFNGEEGVKQVQFAAAIQKSAEEERVISVSDT
ncbi:MAG: Gfo/Idh/MocA family oxidoreductase [Thaumarchaeota archaeon]|nr:Gfo/Idh/MocA family oxidoreductase [Nitrososphaerota archaeon]